MRLNKQNTDQRIFGTQSDRGTGAQMFGAVYLSDHLTVRLMSWARILRAKFERGASTLSVIARANPVGTAGNQANHLNSPDLVGPQPSLGCDRASRVGWIAG